MKRILTVAIFLVLSSVAGFSADMVGPLDYSGWDVDDALFDFSQKVKTNLIGSVLPGEKINCFKLPAEIYWVEALSILAANCGRRARKFGSTWLLISAETGDPLDNPVSVLKAGQYRSRESLYPIFRRILFPGAALWLPPNIEHLAFHGRRDQVDEFKKVFETVDTPTHEIKMEWRLEDSGSSKLLASWTQPVKSQTDFSSELGIPGKDGGKFDIAGKARMNDDGMVFIRFRVTAEIAHQTESRELNIVGADGEMHEMQFQAAGRLFRLSVRGSSLFPGMFPSRILAETGKNGTAAEGGREAHTEANHNWGDEAVTEMPFVKRRVSVSALIEELSEKAGIELICESSASGTVSVFGFADEPPTSGEVLSLVAKACGYEVHDGRRGLIVGAPRAIRDLVVDGMEPTQSGPLRRITPPEAGKALVEGFRELDMAGKFAKGHAPGSLQAKAETSALAFFHALTDLWSEFPLEFDLGWEVKTPKGTRTEKGLIGIGKPLKMAFNQDSSRFEGFLEALSFENYHSGLTSAEYRVSLENPGGGRLVFKGFTNVVAPPHSFIEVQGALPFELRWAGKFQVPQEPTETPPEYAPVGNSSPTSRTPFDDAFDPGF